MFPSPEVWARVDAIEAKLAELDPIIQSFCERRGFTFSKMVDENRTLWPRRGMWVREDIDRCMHLTMDLTVAEVMERGFYLEMPWSLHADATLPVARGQPIRILNTDVFRGVPYSRLAHVLGQGLEDGLAALRRLTREDVITRGEVVGPPPGSSGRSS
jgi:hypothetical protein